MLESLFNKVGGLTPIFTLYSAPSFSSSLLLLLISPMLVFGSNLKGFKEFKSGISFSLKSLSINVSFVSLKYVLTSLKYIHVGK